MFNRISRRFFLGGVASLAGGAVQAGAPGVSLRPQLRPNGLATDPGAGPLISKSGLSGKISFAVADVTGGEVLEAHAPLAMLPPASVTKVVTALYALDTLGDTHRFTTKLVATGPVQNGRLDGDLVLVGGGDPTLDTNGLAILAARLKAAGVHEVRGRFLVWGGALPFAKEIDPDQPDHVGYNPAVSGICLNYNRVHFEWKPGANGFAVTMDARSSKYRPEVQVAAMKVVTRKSPVYTYEDRAGRDQWTVAQGALGKGGARWLPVRKPEIYVGEVFQTLARAHGIVLKTPKMVQKRALGTPLVSLESAPLIEILRGMLKYSTNITAEMVGLSATARRGVAVNSLKASAQEMSRWGREQLGMKNLQLVDHSGLGDASRMRVDELLHVLVQSARHKMLMPIMKEVSLRHENGAVNRQHPIKVHAKTGTLHFVSALAGYATSPGGKPLAFAILTADTETRRKTRNKFGDRPRGARTWNRRSKTLQQKLIERWSRIVDTS